MEKIFGLPGERLLRQFIETDILDYDKYKRRMKIVDGGTKKVKYDEIVPGSLNKEGQLYVETTMENIAKEIKSKFKNGFNRFIIRSIGNSGVLLRELVIDGKGKYFNINKGNLITVLCTCGNINHWGKMYLEEKNDTRNPN